MPGSGNVAGAGTQVLQHSAELIERSSGTVL